ncbi:MAG: histidine kinase [Chlorobi bacterium OLB5]|nr:MAG: histidine kinase [Chlorobi bacterium OLB5]
MPNKSIDDLRKVVVLHDLPEDIINWIYEKSEYIEIEEGVLFYKKDEPAEHLWLIPEGRFDFYMDVNGQEVLYYNFQNDNVTGGVGGLLPYSRMKVSPGNAYTVAFTKVFKLHKKYFDELAQVSPELNNRLISYMTERARAFATIKLQQEKVSALGKLAAGIAHEMNNPASAINRIAAELTKRLKDNYDLTGKLLQFNISPELISKINALVQAKEKTTEKKLSMSEKMNREDEIESWLQKNVKGGSEITGDTFVDAGITVEDLAVIKNDVGEEEFIHILYWVENLLISQRILFDLHESSSRISHLVSAIKSHVHMDQTNELTCTDIHRDIENTLTLMGYKIREKNITIKKIFAENLPEVPVYIGEMNQVWTNIIDNAIYAMQKGGELTIETFYDSKNVCVKICDNGTGIPPEILSRIFDPFFTTKKVGEGTGIGLDLVNRIIKNHNGEIKVFSKPGNTEFKIYIPVQDTKGDKK